MVDVSEEQTLSGDAGVWNSRDWESWELERVGEAMAERNWIEFLIKKKRKQKGNSEKTDLEKFV